MNRRTWSSMLAIILAVHPVFAQQQPSNELPRLVETVDVRVINLDVVVTDRKGNVIRGLTMDDFIVLENGRQQNITNFYEVGARAVPAPSDPTATPAEPPAPAAKPEETPAHLRRRIVFFIDNLSLAPFNRNRVFQSMKKFAQDALRPGDEAMIVTWNRALKVRVPFTADPIQLQQAFDAIAGESAMGLQNISDRRSTESRIRETNDYHQAVVLARQYAQSIEHELRQSVSAINGLMTTLAGLEGKKILVLTSEGFPIQPGREMFYFIDDIQREKNQWQGAGSSLLEGMGFNASSLIESIAKSANGNGITLYTLHAGGLAGTSEMSAEHAQPVSHSVNQSAITNSTESLQLLAEVTGGLAVVGTNNFADGFRRIGRDLDSYYSIGYRSGTERIDRQRNVAVKAKNRDYLVRSRRTFVEKSIPTEMSDRVIANLFYPSSTNDLGITVITGQPKLQDNGTFRVPIEVHIPMESLTFLPQGETMAAGFSAFVVVSNKQGDMSDVSHQSQSVHVPPADMEKIKGKYFNYSMDLIMEKGRNKISVGVIEEIGNVTGFDQRDILAADLR